MQNIEKASNFDKNLAFNGKKMKKFSLFSRYLPDGPHNTKGLPVILVGTVWLEKKRLIKSPQDEI